ncbi:hypothetical protein LCGC14_2808870 [marine sediment metagenome]|uniref:Uncharacterized protein n=1 Tax=marine sediment metagenome TaxID=412755 RepID=A0A0F9BBV1_9ZZZZ
MKLWLLGPLHTEGDDPWDPWYDKAFGFVIRAETEQRAREIANENSGDENRGKFLGQKTANTKSPWLDPKYSTCEELLQDGPELLVLRDFAAA